MVKFPIFTSLFRVLFPISCIGCGLRGYGLCSTCIASLPSAPRLSYTQYASFHYRHPFVKAAIRQLKYHRRSETARALVEAMREGTIEHLSSLLQTTAQSICIFVPVPTDRARSRERGFSPTARIAEWILPAVPGSIVYPNLLHKTRHTKPQAKLTRRERLHNVVHTFVCKTELDSHALYIVVDDVITTGATCAEAERALRLAGARHIACIAIAHG